VFIIILSCLAVSYPLRDYVKFLLRLQIPQPLRVFSFRLNLYSRNSCAYIDDRRGLLLQLLYFKASPLNTWLQHFSPHYQQAPHSTVTLLQTLLAYLRSLILFFSALLLPKLRPNPSIQPKYSIPMPHLFPCTTFINQTRLPPLYLISELLLLGRPVRLLYSPTTP
jgi:hypothetical protein